MPDIAVRAPSLASLSLKLSSPSPTPSAGTSTAPNHGEVFRDQGLELSEKEEYDGAIAMYDAALKYSPSDTTALLYRSYAHSLRPNPRIDLALRDADSTIGWEPTNWKAWKQKGELLRKQGNYQGAIEALEHAVGCSSGIDRMGNKDLLKSTQAKAAQPSSPPLPDKTPHDYVDALYEDPVSAHSSFLPPPTSLTERPKSGVSAITPSEYSQPTSPAPAHATYKAPGPTVETQPAPIIPESIPAEQKSPTSPTRKPAPVEHTPAPAPVPDILQPGPSTTTTTPAKAEPERPIQPTQPVQSSFQSPVPAPNTSTPLTTPAPTTNPTLPTDVKVPPPPPPPRKPPQSSPSQSSVPPTTPGQGSAEASRSNVDAQPPRQPQVVRNFNAETVNQIPNTNALPISGADLLNAPQPNDPPPGYTPPTAMTVTEVNRRLDTLSVSLAGKNKGSLSLRPYTTADGIDAIQLLYVGMIQAELTDREIGRPRYLHTTFSE